MSEKEISELVEVDNEKEKALLELLRFKVTHCSAVVHALPKSPDNKDAAEQELQDLVEKMVQMGYSREKLEMKIYSFWRYAEAVYSGKKNVKEPM